MSTIHEGERQRAEQHATSALPTRRLWADSQRFEAEVLQVIRLGGDDDGAASDVILLLFEQYLGIRPALQAVSTSTPSLRLRLRRAREARCAAEAARHDAEMLAARSEVPDAHRTGYRVHERRALGRVRLLSALDRRIVLAAIIDEEPAANVAAELRRDGLRLTPEAIRKRLQRALETLRG